MTRTQKPTRCPVHMVATRDGGRRPETGLDPHSAAFSAHLYDIYRDLHSSGCPVAWSTERGGFWVLSDHASVFDATRDHETFSSAQGVVLKNRYGSGGGQGGIPVETDPPDTMEYRKAVLADLSPGRVKALEPEITELADELVDGFIEHGEADVVQEFTMPLPAITLLGLLGLDPSEYREWIDLVHGHIHSDTGDAALATFTRINEILDGRENAAEPRDDIIGHLMTARVHGRPLTRSEQERLLFLLFQGGMDTTAGLTGNSLATLARYPELRSRLIADRGLLPQAAEEFLRHGTPTQGIFRTVTRDVDFHGQRLRTGDKVYVLFSAANRDPAEFTEPDSVILDRESNRHVTFGLGVHRCIGSNLARTMFRIMMDTVLDRLPDYELVGEPEYFPDAAVVYAMKNLRIRFTPGAKRSHRKDA